jgi:hypothetical protein
MCGAVGNCALWVLDQNDQLILDRASGKRITISNSSHDGQADILIASHNSAFEEDRITYRFDGAQYRPYACAYADYADPTGNPYKHPQITAIRCKLTS